jgi:hypothetical protein
MLRHEKKGRTDLELLDVTVLLPLELVVDDAPRHRRLNHVVVVRILILRDRVEEDLRLVETAKKIRNC